MNGILFGNFDKRIKSRKMENMLGGNSKFAERICTYIESLNVSGELSGKEEVARREIRSNELFQSGGENPIDALSGVCIGGIHYYDFKNIQFINNTGIASLIDLLKCLLQQGVKVQFVNVNEKIKNKIKSMGLENILICT